MIFEEGDKVSCTHSNLRGTVLKVLGKKHVLVLDDETGMELDYHTKTLVKVETTLHQFTATPAIKDMPARQSAKSLTIDLHTEKLPGNYRTQPPLQGQLDFFDYKIALAIQQGATQVTVVHGKGTGALKNEVVKRLRSLKQVKEFTDPEKILALKNSKLLVKLK